MSSSKPVTTHFISRTATARLAFFWNLVYANQGGYTDFASRIDFGSLCLAGVEGSFWVMGRDGDAAIIRASGLDSDLGLPEGFDGGLDFFDIESVPGNN
jgi:hypothetical protein